jgi:hypothetical protein
VNETPKPTLYLLKGVPSLDDLLALFKRLTLLRLCRAPGRAVRHGTTAEDVAAIAARFGTDTAALRRVVEETTL